jgi:predicted HNH restriction endonuclease
MQVPSATRYRAALRQIRAQITPLQWRLLESHYLAPDHTASAEEIALAGGKPWQVTNSQYGRLGTNLRRALRQPLVRGEQQSTILAFFERPHERLQPWKWVMHSSLASAIRGLGWFSAEGIGTHPLIAQLAPLTALEGERQRRLVIHRHREMSLRRAKLDAFRREHDGRLFCEVPGCGFNFEVVYGELGSGFAEVHHLAPLGERGQPVSTTLADLAVVCANCHRMIHRNNDSRTLEGLVPKFSSRRSRRRPSRVIG